MTTDQHPFDPDFRELLAALPPIVTTLHPQDINELRQLQAANTPGDIALSRDGALTLSTAMTDEAPMIELLIIRRSAPDPAEDRPAMGPAVLWLHGGGTVAGTNREIHSFVLDAAEHHGAIVVSPQYRLAPEHPYPAPVNDVLSGLHWVFEHAAEHGIDTDRVVIAGASAGGGLAAAATILARDSGGPLPAAQILIYPMLDDRMTTASAQQLDGVGVWDRTSNRTGWNALLAGRAGAENIPPSAAPARLTDAARLPPTYIDTGSVETFRDEAINYAALLNQAGVPTDLHVWAGGFHGFDQFAPTAAQSVRAVQTRSSYLSRALAGQPMTYPARDARAMSEEPR